MPEHAPLDYAALTEGERVTVETLYYGEFSQYERGDLPCSAKELKRLVKQGWMASSPERVETARYDQAHYRPACYWLTGAGVDALVEAEQQARIDFWLKQERTAKILCFPLQVEYQVKKSEKVTRDA